MHSQHSLNISLSLQRSIRISVAGDTEESVTVVLVLNLVGTSAEGTLFTGLGAGESKHAGTLATEQIQLVVPGTWCIDETTDCFSQSQHIFHSQCQPTLEIRRWVSVQRIASLKCRISIAALETCLQVSTFQQVFLFDNPLQNC